MPTAKNLRERMKPLGIKGLWRMKKAPLLWCNLAFNCKLRMRHAHCALTQEPIHTVFIADGVLFERSRLKEYLNDHAVESKNPVTRKLMNDADLQALGLDPRAVLESCKFRNKHAKSVESVCEAYDMLIADYRKAVDPEQPACVRLELTSSIYDNMPMVDASLKELCETSWKQKRLQLQNITKPGSMPYVLYPE